MASSSIVFGMYPARTAASGFTPMRTQLRTWLPVLACSIIFAVESTSYLGADHTSEPLRRIAELLCGYGVDVHWQMIHHAIRKTGHFMGYGIFSLVCFRAFWMSFRSAASRLLRQLRAHGLAILAAFLVAGADELHQSFLPNRYGCFSDVLLDTCGAAALCLLLFVAMQAAELWQHSHPRSIWV
jgi:VanZ family protein